MGTEKSFYPEKEKSERFPEFEKHGYWKCTCCGITGNHCEECGKELDESEFMESPLARSLCKQHRSTVEGNVYVGK